MSTDGSESCSTPGWNWAGALTTATCQPPPAPVPHGEVRTAVAVPEPYIRYWLLGSMPGPLPVETVLGPEPVVLPFVAASSCAQVMAMALEAVGHAAGSQPPP